MNLYNLFDMCLNVEYKNTKEDGSYAFLKKGATLYLFFEGSHGDTDWKNNLDFPAEAYKEMGITWYCHRGFLKVWKSIEPYVKDAITDTSLAEIVIVGYSHGAAIATLAHEYAWYNRPDIRENIHGYGFGCPRCYFGEDIPEKLKKRWQNFHPVRNINDLVTHLPPIWLGYKHVNKVLEIGSSGKYTKIDAHRSENYLTELKEYSKK